MDTLTTNMLPQSYTQAQDPSSASTSDWISTAADALRRAGFSREAAALADCGQSFNVDVCQADVSHEPQIRPITCHLRYCQPCQRREQSRKLARYLPLLGDLAEQNIPGYSLKKFELTTPYALSSPNAAADYRRAWQYVRRTLEVIFFRLLKTSNRLSLDELRRGRADLKAHNIGVLAAAEFGERGHRLHFHLIAYCPFVPKDLLTQVWQQVTGDECRITWIRRLNYHDIEGELKETTKYVTKFTALPPRLVPTLATVLKGTRSFRTYGLLHGAPLPHKEPHTCPVCDAARQRIPPLSYLDRCITQGSPPEDLIITAIERLFTDVSLLDLKHGNNSGESRPRQVTTRPQATNHTPYTAYQPPPVPT
jgi:hypothetical protein